MYKKAGMSSKAIGSEGPENASDPVRNLIFPMEISERSLLVAKARSGSSEYTLISLFQFRPFLSLSEASSQQTAITACCEN
jgi:hypothetical protein